ncbi:MAG: hypothetical protein D6727_04325 [Gammaproteobacteria bacterium]|nr:MAG: hypothetical protein D6727_04325 [Gammaproteobacteria bacterium]
MPEPGRRPCLRLVVASACLLLPLLAAALTPGPEDALLPPGAGDPDWHIAVSGADELAVAGNGQRRALAAALRHYRALEAAGGWPAVPAGPILRPGQRDARIAPLRVRLRLGGDWQGEMQADPKFFDAALADALRHFQRRHGLPASGELDPATVAALNVPAADRAAQLLAALQRWRWLPAQMPADYIWVNTAAAELTLVDDGRERLKMRTVVGHPSRPTPSLRSEIGLIVVNPAWVVPPSIARKDILPRQIRNPDYLGEKRFTVYSSWQADGVVVNPRAIDWQALSDRRFPYRLVQAPGPWNSLGRVKFVMPNAWDIYLHDTNAAWLFALSRRAFSSGCIRLADAPRLALEVLEMSGGPAELLPHYLHSGRTRALALPEALPVYLVYQSAWIDAAGEINFRDDAYGRDRRLAEAIQAMTTVPGPGAVAQSSGR